MKYQKRNVLPYQVTLYKHVYGIVFIYHNVTSLDTKPQTHKLFHLCSCTFLTNYTDRLTGQVSLNSQEFWKKLTFISKTKPPKIYIIMFGTKFILQQDCLAQKNQTCTWTKMSNDPACCSKHIFSCFELHNQICQIYTEIIVLAKI